MLIVAKSAAYFVIFATSFFLYSVKSVCISASLGLKESSYFINEKHFLKLRLPIVCLLIKINFKILADLNFKNVQ